MKIKWYQYFSIGAFVAGWLSRSAADGKITKAERLELANGLIEMIMAMFPEDIELD